MRITILGAAACAALACGGARAANCALTQADQTYLQDDASGAAYELQIATLATQKAGDADVKRYAQMVTQDHEKYNAELQQLGQACGMSLPTTPTAAQQAKIAQLQPLSGNLFDAAFITQARAINLKDSEDSRREEGATQNAQVKAFIAKFKATDEKHTQAAEAINAEGPGHG